MLPGEVPGLVAWTAAVMPRIRTRQIKAVIWVVDRLNLIAPLLLSTLSRDRFFVYLIFSCIKIAMLDIAEIISPTIIS